MTLPLIETTSEEVRSRQLKILLEIDSLCKAQDIKYVLFAGTLLGAVRHSGFIPWDDDIDVAMTRHEYNRFLQACQKHLSSDFFLQSFRTDPEYFNQHVRIRLNNTVFMQGQYKEFEMHHGIFVDVFPFDNAFPNNPARRLKHITSIRFVRFISKLFNYGTNKRFVASHPSIFKRLSYRVLHPLLRIFPKHRINYFYERQITKMNSFNSKFCTHLTWRMSQKYYGAYMAEKSFFDDTIALNFEGHNFPAPKNYDKWLTSIYGDYMTPPPKRYRKPHHGVIRIEFNDD